MAQPSSTAAIARRHLIFGFVFVLFGMSLGLYMSVSHDYALRPVHVHMNLVGFVLSLLYAIVYRLWLAGASSTIASVQIWLHQAGAVLMAVGLALIFGKVASEAAVGPLLGLASLAVIVAAVMTLFQILGTGRNE